MRDERTEAEKLAFTLDYIVHEGCVPGLLPKDVTAAAELLREQEKELTLLRTALASKDHVVEAEAESENYRTRIRGTFIITSPRIYYGEIFVDDRLAAIEPDYAQHVARQLVSVATADWIEELRGRAYVAIRKAIDGTRRGDETPKTGGRAKMGMSENG